MTVIKDDDNFFNTYLNQTAKALKADVAIPHIKDGRFFIFVFKGKDNPLKFKCIGSFELPKNMAKQFALAFLDVLIKEGLLEYGQILSFLKSRGTR